MGPWKLLYKSTVEDEGTKPHDKPDLLGSALIVGLGPGVSTGHQPQASRNNRMLGMACSWLARTSSTRT